MKFLSDMGPAKLHAAEASIIRDAADALLFSATPGDSDAAEATSLLDRLLSDLVASERWTPEAARRLNNDVAACGPAFALA